VRPFGWAKWRDGGPNVEPEVVGASETKVGSAEEALFGTYSKSMSYTCGMT